MRWKFGDILRWALVVVCVCEVILVSVHFRFFKNSNTKFPTEDQLTMSFLNINNNWYLHRLKSLTDILNMQTSKLSHHLQQIQQQFSASLHETLNDENISSPNEYLDF